MSETEVKIVPVGMGQVVERFITGVQRAGGHLVQQGFPYVGALVIDQRDLRQPSSPQAVAETGRQFQTAGASPDDDYTMRIGHGCLLWRFIQGV